MSDASKPREFDPYCEWLGILPGPRPPSPEVLLGLLPGETDKDRIVDAGARQKQRLDGLMLSKDSQLAGDLTKEVAGAVSVLLQRAEAVVGQPIPSPGSKPSGPPLLPAAETVVESRVAEAADTIADDVVGPTQSPEEQVILAEVVEEPTGEKGAEPGSCPFATAQPVQPRRRWISWPARAVRVFFATLFRYGLRGVAVVFRGAVRLLVAPVRLFDRLLAAIAGRENVILHNFFRVLAAGAVAALLAFMAPRIADDYSAPVRISLPKEPPALARKKLRLQPVAPQSIEAGKQLTLPLSVEDAAAWQGKLRFTLGENAPAGARIEPETGTLTWTPVADQRPGPYDLTVWVDSPDAVRDLTTFTITVTRPPPPTPPTPAEPAVTVMSPRPPASREMTLDLGRGVTMELVLIPAGSFLMGSPDSDNSGRTDEKPQHAVRITRPFYLGKHEVTQEQWEAVMGDRPSPYRGPKNPVENASWEACQTFLSKLGEKLDNPFLDSFGSKFRLPTEAEWEYACRAGSTTRWHFGNEESRLGDYAWCPDNPFEDPHPVGKSRPNGWGLYDMHGNVREWCADRYAADYYSRSPGEDPTGPSFGNERVLRGGSCTADVASECRSASRFGAAPTYQDDSGFRVVCVRNAGASDPFVAMPSKPLRLLPVAPRTIGVGNELRVAVPVEDAERWEGKLRFSLDRKAPSGARVDAETGEFVWTPAEGQGPGKYDVVVSVEGPEGRRSQVSFSITVTRAHAPAEKGVTLDLGGGVTMEFVLIPAGSFLMGSPDSTGQVDDGEKPQHEVRITKPFYLGKYEVTQEQWEAVMGENPSTFKGTDNPVEQVSWEDCQEFLSRLREKLDTPWSSCRLPTEAEWEYACRAGSTKKYTFGDEDANLGDYAWFSRNAGSKTNPVGQKKPNAWGLYDMHGNVCEWCADRYGENYYSQSPEKDPTGPIFGSTHVLRGGSWTVDASSCRSAARDENSPASRGSSYGFRVVCVK